MITKLKMASQCAAAAAAPSQLVLGFHPPVTRARLALAAKITPFSHDLRFKNNVRLERRPRLLALFAAKSNRGAGDCAAEKIDGNAIEAVDSGEGPPFLTILAGFIVFLLVCWILGSVLMWVIGLIIRLLPSK